MSNMPKNSKSNLFGDFTNLYELSKTLRFELKPVGNTQKMLEENEVFKKDKIVDENYRKIKYYFDVLHREFAKESLKEAVLNYKEYYTELKNDQKSKKLLKIEEELRKKMVKFFDKKADDWKEILSKQNIKLKKNGVEILFEKDNLEILKKIFQKKNDKIYFIDISTGETKKIDDINVPDIEIKTIAGEKENLFESFEGFQGYLTNFHQSRKNFYSEKDQTTAISNRAINENLRRFCDNLKQFEEKKEEYAQAGLIKKEANIFDLDFYNNCLVQEGIDSYNEKIGRKSNAEEEKGINQKINEFNQKNKDKKLRQFKSLYKQILSPREQKINAEIEKDEEVFVKMREFLTLNNKKNEAASKLFFDFTDRQEKYVIGEVYIKGAALNTISSRWFSSWAAIGEKIMTGKGDNKKFPDFVSFGELKKQFDAKNTEIKAGDLFRAEYKKIYEKSPSHYETFLRIWKKEFENNIGGYERCSRELQEIIKEGKIFGKKDREKQIEKIKNYADSALGIFQMMKYFALEKGKKKAEDVPQDQNFYNVFNEYYYGEEDYNLRFIQIYNGLRNYLTKKQFKTDKIKLNFENSTLLNGWDKNKESDNFGVILRKDGKYYLGLMKPESNRIFDKVKNGGKMSEDTEKCFYEKMVYKFLPDPKKMLPKVCFSEKNRKLFSPSEEILRIKQKEEFKIKTEYFSTASMQKMIDFYRNALIVYEDWKVFDFASLKPTAGYKNNIGEFYRDVEVNSYQTWFENISQKYINEKIENGELYLFEIYNKDFADGHIGSKNLHTIYWENIFKKENEKNPIFKLNGQAEIFFRLKSINKKEKITTKENEIVLDKDCYKGKKAYKVNRYAEDKYLFHCPIKLNFACHDEKVNNKVIKTISETNKIRLIGIDRGEKHLLYLSVIDLDGNIHQIKSLNVISSPGNKPPVDYHKLLDDKEKGRDEARKSWQNIENIKELKSGYISQVVNEICKIIFDCFEKGEFPVVVFEDLNIGFKRGRFAIEKQVYQKFELALAKKLNYLISKAEANQREALQLTPLIGNFQDINRQTGIIFYIPASFTSAICPVCGFRKRLTGFYFENKTQAKNLLKDSLQDLRYDGEKFVFIMKTGNTGNNKKFKKENPNELFADKKLSLELRFSSAVERLVNRKIYNTKKWETIPFSATEELKNIFGYYKIETSSDLKNSILQGDFEADFYKRFIFAINTILKIRNSHTAENRDFIACPACEFHSEKDLKSFDKKYSGSEKFEFNGDANGAYNIARKGILVMKKIKQFAEKNGVDKIKFEHLTTNMEEWDKFVQKD